MNRLLLDTSFLVDIERGGEDLHGAVLDEDDAAIAAVVVAELEAGVHLTDDRHRARRRAFVDQVVEELPVIPYDLAVAREHGRLLAHTRRSGRPRGQLDLVIAATAAASGRQVVSADVGAFDDLPGVALLGG